MALRLAWLEEVLLRNGQQEEQNLSPTYSGRQQLVLVHSLS